jgi:hypothetical protein
MTQTNSASTVLLPAGLNFIGGQWLDDSAAERLPVFDPATGAVLGHIPNSRPATVDQAVQAARAALRDTARRPISSCTTATTSRPPTTCSIGASGIRKAGWQ